MLKRAGLETDGTDFDNLHVKRDPGSVALLRLGEGYCAQDVILRVASARTTYLTSGKTVWMSIQRSSSENKRLRVMYRAGDMMKELAATKGSSCEITTKAHHGQVEIDKVLGLFRIKDKLTWATKGLEVFTPEERLQVEGFAEQ